MVTRVNFRAAMRAAAVTLLGDYAQDASLNLQIYPGRPMSVYAPSAFVDRVSESNLFTGPTMRQQVVRAEVVVLHGLFDSKEAVDQADAFVDGFGAYVTEQYHAAGASTLIAGVDAEDDPGFTPDWGSETQRQTTYFATRITLEGFANN